MENSGSRLSHETVLTRQLRIPETASTKDAGAASHRLELPGYKTRFHADDRGYCGMGLRRVRGPEDGADRGTTSGTRAIGALGHLARGLSARRVCRLAHLTMPLAAATSEYRTALTLDQVGTTDHSAMRQTHSRHPQPVPRAGDRKAPGQRRGLQCRRRGAWAHPAGFRGEMGRSPGH